MPLDGFLDRPDGCVPTSAGEAVVPALYRDTSVAFAWFGVEYPRAEKMLEGTPFAPARHGRRGALAVVAALDHRDSPIGPLREVGVGLAVVPRGVSAPASTMLHLLRASAHRDVGLHLLDLPATTAIADARGREPWGFPRFVTDIAVNISEHELFVAVQAPQGEDPILVLEGSAGWGVTLGATDLVLYSLREGEILRTVVETRGRMHLGLGRGLTLRVGRSDHPMAGRLALLGLDGARASAVQCCRHYQLVLDAGEPYRLPVSRAA